MRADTSSQAGALHTVHVHLDHGRSPERWRSRYELGEVATPMSYGYEHADGAVRLRFSTDSADTRIGLLLRRASRLLLGFDLPHLVRNLRAIADADAVWTHTEYEWAGIAVAQRLGLCRRPLLVAQSVWLWDRWGDRGLRQVIWRRAARHVDVHVTLSPVNARIASRTVAPPVVFIPFGIDPVTRLPPPMHRTQVGVVAPGNDPGRDWATLVEAARLDPSLSVRILSSRFEPDDGLPDSVTAGPASGAAALRQAFLEADVVAVPLGENGHASGVTVALEALSAGRPLAVSRAGGIEAYVDGVAALAPVGDAAALRTAILAAAAAPPPAAGLLERRGLTARDYALRLARLTIALLDGEAVPDDIDALAPQRIRRQASSDQAD